MKRHLIVIVCLLTWFCSTHAADGAKLRTWTSKSGKYTVNAEFLFLPDAEGVVTLRRANGKKIDIPLDKLSMGDQVYVHNMMGNHELAIAACESAIAINPDDAKAYVSMGRTLRNRKRNTEAIAAFKSAIAIKPDYAEAYFSMGFALHNLKRYTEAIAAFKSAIAIKPDYAEAYFSMGLALGNLERYTEAITAYKSAIASKPDFAAEVYFRMGNALHHMERNTEAIAALKSAIAVDPDSQFARAAADMLRRLEPAVQRD